METSLALWSCSPSSNPIYCDMPVYWKIYPVIRHSWQISSLFYSFFRLTVIISDSILFYLQIKKLFKTDGKQLNLGERLLSGSMAGIVSQTSIYPMEVSVCSFLLMFYELEYQWKRKLACPENQLNLPEWDLKRWPNSLKAWPVALLTELETSILTLKVT